MSDEKQALDEADRAAELAGQTDLAPETTAGIVSSQGNQGTQNTAHLMGQAGTGCQPWNLPRLKHFGGV
jgi:hypothetical protein